MHQPYYQDLFSKKAYLPWVRLHGTKDYLDMVAILESYPNIHQNFNLVPSLLEQLELYVSQDCQDRFLELSYKRVEDLNSKEKRFILEHFFLINERNVIAIYPRYYELFLKNKAKKEFSEQDYLDLQVWFNLSWIDPLFLEKDEDLSRLVSKARYFSQQDKIIVLEKQKGIIRQIVSTYKNYQDKGQIEISVSPFYHPILPLIYDLRSAKAADFKITLPNTRFKFRDDCRWHISKAVEFYKDRFGSKPLGMWPSEQAVSNQIIPLLIEQDLKWIVTDEGILFRTLKKERNAVDLYKTYTFEAKNGNLTILFRDRYLSDLIGFVYHNYSAQMAVLDFVNHLSNILNYFNKKNCYVVIAMDGENAWEYYRNDGRDFLNLLYERLSEAKDIKVVTVKEFLQLNQVRGKITKIKAGSWINSNFNKWVGHPSKNKAWQLISQARQILEKKRNEIPPNKIELIYKQMYILEGSDWFWWYGEKNKMFDELFRLHLKNFYSLIDEKSEVDLNKPLE